jgi:hypothetical protein
MIYLRITKVSLILTALLIILFNFNSLAKKNEESQTKNTFLDSDIAGLWLREVPSEIGGVEGKEGFLLKKDGMLLYIGVATMNGLKWTVSEDKLIMTSNTDRYPESYEVKYEIEKLTDDMLIIKADDYFSGSYSRENPESSSVLIAWQNIMDDIYISNVRDYVKYVDENNAKYKKVEKILEPENKGWEKRKLVLYTQDGKPIMLSFTEPDDAGKMHWATKIYYLDGNLYFYDGAFSGYIFKNERMVLWLDENMKPLSNIPQKDILDASKSIKKKSKQYLDLFASSI